MGPTVGSRRIAPAAPRLPARGRLGLVVSAVLVAAAVLHRFDPAEAWFFPPCLFFTATGLACPGCGTTRALHALLHLDLAAAFGLSPLLFVLPIVGTLWLMAARRRPAPAARRWVGSAPWILAALVLAFTVWRNLPGYPFARLSNGLHVPFVASGR